MTSELKPIDIWDDATNAVCQAMQQSKMCKCPDGECLASTIEPSKETLAHWNTRAVPYVPELVRYSADGIMWGIDSPDGAQPNPNGEYVLHSQAAEIIAAKDAEISRLKNLIDGDNCTDADKIDALFRRAEAAEAKNIELEAAWLNAEGKISDLEAKLAQYEAQEPVVYTLIFRKSYGVNAETTFKKFEDAEKYAIRCELPLSSIIPLYASPAPAADLKTKLSRYEQALRDIAAFKEKDRTDAATTQWNRAGVYAATIARAALNVEASNDKG